MNDSRNSRREFLEFFGRSAAALSLSSVAIPAWAKTAGQSVAAIVSPKTLPFEALKPTAKDELVLAKGFEFKRLISWGDPINSAGDSFGFNNDYLAFFPSNAKGDDGVLWVNHETTNPIFVSGWVPGGPRTKEQVAKEQRSVGGSLLRVRKTATGWEVVKNDPLNRRLHAQTEIPFVAPRPIQGATKAVGTMGNCAGGVTPWKTVLTCEENYDIFYGEALYEGAKGSVRKLRPSRLGWEAFTPNPPEHYGWVVEVNPLTGAAKKLTALGRFAHEGATCTTAKDGRCVVYMGDDGDDRCLYKFIGDKAGSLETGTLYVANLETGRWIPLSYEKQETLKKEFNDQVDVLIRCRDAAPLIGGSKLDRPEDIEIDPLSGAVFVSLTNNIKKDRYFGSILKLEEKAGDPLALEFKASTFISGGPESGLSCPDNLAFDKKGNLWVTTDIAGSLAGKAPYESFGHNSLFYIPMSGANAGKAYAVASAPTDAELTGIYFSPDQRTLFLCVQHPGEESTSLSALTSHWPDGGKSVPKSTVVTIEGPALNALIG